MVQKLFKKWKSSKSFRNTVIIIAFIVILFGDKIGTDLEQVTFSQQAICDTCGDGILNVCDDVECISLNCVPKKTIIGPLDCKAGYDIGDKVCIEDYYLTNYPSIFPTNMCKEGLVAVKQDALNRCSIFQDKDMEWICMDEDIAEDTGATIAKPCRSWEKPFAKLLDSLWKGNDISDCTTKSYLVIGAGAMVVLAIL